MSLYYLVGLEHKQLLDAWRALGCSRVGVRAHSFPVRGISIRNRLPSAVLAENILQFKTSLTAIDLSYALLGKN